MWWRKKQRAAAKALLVDLQNGAILKVHRTLDGAKVHKLHRHGVDATEINIAIVRYLEKQNLIQSNMKFPAATYLLTEQGAATRQRIDGSSTKSLTARTSVGKHRLTCLI